MSNSLNSLWREAAKPCVSQPDRRNSDPMSSQEINKKGVLSREIFESALKPFPCRAALERKRLFLRSKGRFLAALTRQRPGLSNTLREICVLGLRRIWRVNALSSRSMTSPRRMA